MISASNYRLGKSRGFHRHLLDNPRVIIYRKDCHCFVPACRRQRALLKQRKVNPDDELGVVVNLVDRLLGVAVPKDGGHVVGGTCEDVCMERRESDFLHRELMPC